MVERSVFSGACEIKNKLFQMTIHFDGQTMMGTRAWACVCLKETVVKNPNGDLSVWHTHTSCVNTIGSGRNSCVIWMVLFLASLEGIRRLTSCSVWWWHLSILIRDVTQSDRHAQKNPDYTIKATETWRPLGNAMVVCVYVCVYKTQQATEGGRGDGGTESCSIV